MKARKQVNKSTRSSRPKQDRRIGRSGRSAGLTNASQPASLNPAAGLSPPNMLQWQQAIGNRAVTRLVSTGPNTLHRQTAGNEPVLRFGSRFEAVKIHEQEHVNIYKKFLVGVHNKCIGLTESEARKAVQEVEDKVDKLQKDFDTKTKNGQTAPQSTKFNAGISCDGCQNTS